MKSRLQGNKLRIFALLVAFVGVLLLVGVLMQIKLRSLLRNHVERQVAAQAKVLAQVTENQMESELEKLEYISGMMENKEDSMGALFEMIRSENKDGAFGILELGGETIYGDVMDVKGFSCTKEAFRGNRAISYKKGSGMLFAVPVYHNGNVKYVLYQFWKDEKLPELFEISFYGGKGKVLLSTVEGELVIPYEEWNEKEIAFLRSETVRSCFAEISEKMMIATEASVLCKGDTPQYMFMAEVGEYDYIIAGSVEEEIAAEGIFVIIRLVFWVFGLLLLLLAIGMAFLFGAEEKAKESEELRKAKEMADTANRAKSDFLANMSHEIRTPINAVVGMNEMIIRESKEEGIKEYAYNIQNASKTLLTLINDILDLSKIEAGKMEIVKDRYFLSSVLNGVVNMIQLKAGQKNLNFHVEVDKTIPDELYGDEIRIRQVMVNLLNNAVKYTKEGSVWFKIGKEELPDNRLLLKITVKDTGIGIKQEDMGKLFEGFERLDKKQNRNVEGTGLGLPITAKIVDLMQGELKVESVYEEGSTFTASFPQEIIQPEEIGDFEEKYHAYIQSLKTYKEIFRAPDAEVLVVDDNEMNLFVFESLLKETQIKVTRCTGGEACLEVVKEKRFDVIFLDHMMPGLDGIETLKRMKQMEDYPSKDTPVVALTANAIVGVREMYIAEGFDDYLSKPVTGGELEKMLQKYIPRDKIVTDYQGNQTENKKEADEKESKAETLTLEQSEKLIDRSIGLRYSADNEEIYREFMKMFCEMTPEKIEVLQKYFDEEDWENYTVTVHALKSTALNVGAKVLSEKALALEKAGKAKQISVIMAKHIDLIQCYEKTIAEGQKMFL